jgi:DNA processing protein
MWEVKSCRKMEDCYPAVLKELKSAPEVLYYVGDISVCNHMVIAVIGKRSAEERYRYIAKKIGAVLAREGCTVLNGLAQGIDAYALEGAVSANGKTVAVMPRGLDMIYPKANTELAERIIASGGCLISEYPNGTSPQKHMFVQRDRIQAMLSSKVFVVDAETDGGTMHTADFATKYARPMGCFVEVGERVTPLGNQMLVDQRRAYAVSDTDGLKAFLEQPEWKQLSFTDL